MKREHQRAAQWHRLTPRRLRDHFLAATVVRNDRHRILLDLERLRELQDRMRDVSIEDHSRTFKTERVAALELACMLDVAEAIAESALRREESRGAHQRTDFPARDDRRFLAHSVISRQSEGSVRVEYLPVRITRWPPGERVYGEVPSHDETDKATSRAISAGARV